MHKIRSVTKSEILKIYKPVSQTAHKGTQGHALLIGGSYGKIGSVCLASKAALKSGCGLVTAFIPKCGYVVLQTAVPEVMVITDRHEKFLSKIETKLVPDAIGIGPGIGKKPQTQKAFHKFLKKNQIPLVVDADALNILSENKGWLGLLSPKTILTPHRKELERLVGSFNSEEERIEMTLGFAKQFDFIVVMKGAPTLILHDGKIYENSSGNQALATAGSGDALTGIITSLIAQGYSPMDAAKLGVYLHGLTADVGIERLGVTSFTASEIIENLGKAFLTLEN